MSAFLIVPTVFWNAYTALEPTPSGAIGTLYNAMNSAKSDYCEIQSDLDNVDFTHGSTLTIPSTIASASAAFWVKFADSIFDDVSPNGHYLKLNTGATIGTVAAKTLVTVYGDATASTNDVVINNLISKTDGFANVIAVYDDQYTSAAWQIQLLNYGTPVNPLEQLYEVMIGHKISIPDGFMREERDISRVHFGGRVGIKKFGDGNWNGIYSYSPRKSFELTMESLSSANRDIFRDVFRYGRGVYPVLVVEDSSDKTKWTKCKMTRYTEEEDTKAFTISIEFDEV